ncbi:MAG: hypothetical protein M3Z41_07510, partial [Candidatus Eremiobacteraeota bacterium]|nr:hypothetical protein [Candidatus Eremiobacteraeota bacterium]
MGAFSDTGSTPVASTILKEGERLIRSRLRWTRASAVTLAVIAIFAGCSRHVTVAPSPHLTVYYCKAGSDDLVRVPFTVDAKLTGSALAT